MSEILRSRDCVVFYKGDTYPVAVDNAMVQGGWPGGQGVMWVPGPGEHLTVSYSNGLFGGLLIWGSDEIGDDYASMTRSQIVYRYATFLTGGCLISTTTYERFTYASRMAGGPFVPLVYHSNDPLHFSLRGYWTVEDEATLVGAPQAPCSIAGFVAQIPRVSNNHFLGVQTCM